MASLFKSIMFLGLLGGLFLPFTSVHARILFLNEVFENDSETYQIGSNDDAASTTLTLEFGGSNSESLTWNTSSFILSDDLSLNDNQITDARIENISALPGGASGLGAAGTGRVLYLDTTDSTAPGCTVSPYCVAAPYLWEGSMWISLAEANSNTFTKIVTVGASGYDYTTVEDAAIYLNDRSGGIMLLAPETHVITSSIDVENMTIIGKDATSTTIQMTGAGQFDTSDTVIKYLTLDIDAVTDTYALDIKAGSSALTMEFVDVNVQDSGDSLVDSSAGTAPTVYVKLLKVNNAGGSGTILKTKAGGNLDTGSVLLVDATSGSSPLEILDWDATLLGGGAVNTLGILTPVPGDSIFVTPNMNLQGAIDSIESVGKGGIITVLPGTHSISSTLTVEDDNITLVGYGEASVIQTDGTFSGITDETAAIQFGLSDGTAPVDGVSVSNLKVEVQDDAIHGIRCAGGADNRVENVTVLKSAGTSGSGATANVGIQFIDGTTEQLTRPVISGSRILGTSGTIYFTDGIHLSSDGVITGVWGNDQGVIYALIEGNNIDYVAETGVVFIGVTDSSMFNNRISRMGANGGYGIFLGNVDNVIMSTNVFTGSLDASVDAIGIEDFNTGSLKSTTDSVFLNNVIDGEASSGAGFASGFVIGDTINTSVNRNIFQDNVINGASSGITTAIHVDGDADRNSFSNNTIYGGSTNAWDIGISLELADQEQNIVSGNRFENVTVLISDSGTATQQQLTVHETTSNPTVNDDAGDGYYDGMVWVNTTDDTSFILIDDSTGAAIWYSLVPRVIDVYDATGNVDIANGVQTVLNLNALRTIDSDAFSILADVITIQEDGLYQVSARLTADSFNTSGGARDHVQFFAQDDTGGTFADIAGAYCEDYMREQSNSAVSASCGFDYIQEYSAGDQVQMVHQSSNTTSMQTVPGGSGLTIIRLR